MSHAISIYSYLVYLLYIYILIIYIINYLLFISVNCELLLLHFYKILFSNAIYLQICFVKYFNFYVSLMRTK